VATAAFVYPAAIVCYLILVNLFVAILLDGISSEEVPDDDRTSPSLVHSSELHHPSSTLLMLTIPGPLF
jgi:hypothetical protein